jgi:hypothetical protein
MAALHLQAGWAPVTALRQPAGLEGAPLTPYRRESMARRRFRYGVGAGLLALGLIGSIAVAVQRSKEDGDRLQHKIDEINRNASAPEPEPKNTPFTESEINSYLVFNIKDKIPKGLANPEINILGNGSLGGRVLVDLDEFKRNRASNGFMDPFNYIYGRVPVTAHGVLRTRDGRGQFYLGSAEIHGITLPKQLVQELVSYFSRTRENPRGFNMDAPFDLPAKIRRIDVNKGEAVMAQ